MDRMRKLSTSWPSGGRSSAFYSLQRPIGREPCFGCTRGRDWTRATLVYRGMIEQIMRVTGVYVYPVRDKVLEMIGRI